MVHAKRSVPLSDGQRLPSSGPEVPDIEQQPADFAINARVRQLLTRRWVNRNGLEVGTTEGVVLLKGPIEREPAGVSSDQDPIAHEQFLWRLRTELKAIPGVIDVVIETPADERTEC